MSVQLFQGDCLDVMPMLADKSIDAFICDIPYGTTQCAWDSVIPLESMWKQVKRLLKERGVFVTTSSQPFTSFLITSNVKWFKEEIIWEKQAPTGFLDANRKHLDSHENICLFSANGHTYNPQGRVKKRIKSSRKNGKTKVGGAYGEVADKLYYSTYGNYPRSVVRFDRITQEQDHPTQKPVSLYEYLILTYTNPGDTVCDFAMGSGTTGEACILTNRNFIGVELMPDYFAIAQKRIQAAQRQMILPLPEKAEPCSSSS